ncbi:MAG: DUF975 family protein [Acidaminococcales bacterium]|nr:DUF975 family protein [Acidaminococcales bacterium]
MPLPTFSFALFVVSWLVAAQFKAGVSLYFLRLVRGDAPGVAAIFASFRDFAAFRRNVWLLLLISAYTFFWSLLLIIPGIVKGLGYSMAWYVKADAPHLSANQAIDASAEMMRGHKMRLFWLDLSFFGWMLSPVVILFILLPYAPFLAFLAAGIATVFANVYLEAAMALFYQNLKEYSAASLPSAEAEAAPGALLR